MARDDGHNQVIFAGVVDGRPLYRAGDGDSDAQLSFYVRSEIDKDDGSADGISVKSRQEVQLWGEVAEDWHDLADGTAVEVTGRLKTWKDTRDVKRLAIAVEDGGSIRESQDGDANEVEIEGEVSDRRSYPPRPGKGGKLAFFAATLHVTTHVHGRDVNAYVPIRVFGRPAEDIADSAGEDAVLRVRRGVLKHERLEGRNDAEPSFQAVVIVDDHLGEVEVVREVRPSGDDRSGGGRRDDRGGDRRSGRGSGGGRKDEGRRGRASGRGRSSGDSRTGRSGQRDKDAGGERPGDREESRLARSEQDEEAADGDSRQEGARELPAGGRAAASGGAAGRSGGRGRRTDDDAGGSGGGGANAGGVGRRSSSGGGGKRAAKGR